MISELILYPPKSPVAFLVFDFPIYWYGIIMVSAIFIAIFFSYYLIKKKHTKTDAELFLDFIPFVIIFSILGARFFYVLGNFPFYFKNIKEIFLINHGGLSFWGGLLFGIISFIIFCKKNKLNFLKFFDILSIALPLAQSIGRWGNYFNQEAYGAPTNGFLKLYIDLKHRNMDYLDVQYFHPAFLYESVLNLILFAVLLIIFLKGKNLKTGTIFYLYLIFYSIIRIIVENIRIDSVLNIFSMPIAMIIASIILISSFILLARMYRV